MSDATFKVCNQCGGIIPTEADAIRNVTGALRIGGSETAFPALDFCCTAHMAAWIGAQPPVPTPNPPYQPPPA